MLNTNPFDWDNLNWYHIDKISRQPLQDNNFFYYIEHYLRIILPKL